MSKTSTEKTINGLTAINGKVFACKVPTEQFAYLDGMLHLLTTEEKVDEASRLQDTLKPLNELFDKIKKDIKSEHNDFIEGFEAVATIKHKTIKRFDSNKIDKLCKELGIDVDSLKTETKYPSLSITSKS